MAENLEKPKKGLDEPVNVVNVGEIRKAHKMVLDALEIVTKLRGQDFRSETLAAKNGLDVAAKGLEKADTYLSQAKKPDAGDKVVA